MMQALHVLTANPRLAVHVGCMFLALQVGPDTLNPDQAVWAS